MQGEADPFWVISLTTDATGRCTYLDERWRAFTGQDPSEALGYGWLDILHPDDREKTVEMLRSVLEMSKPFRIEFRVRRPDGVYRWAMAVGAPRFNESGACLAYVGSIVDIDDRRATEASLAASEERHAFLLKLSDALRPLADPLDIQRQAARLLGARLKAARVHYGEVSEDGAWAVIRDDYCDGVLSAVGKYQLSSYGPLVMTEFRAGRTVVVDDVENDARLTPAEREATAALQIRSYVIAPLLKAGRLAAFLVVHHLAPHRWAIDELSLVEATAERTWEAVERAMAEERLQIAHERLTATLRMSPVHVWEQDRDLRYVWVQNPGLGLDPEQVVGRTDADLFECAEDAETIAALTRSVFDTGAPIRREVRIFSKGEVRWFDISLEPRLSGGEVVGVLCVATDMTERKEAVEDLRRARESLELAVDAGQMGIWDLDLTHDYSGSRNLRHDQIFGYETRQKAWGMEIARRHVLEEDRAAFGAAFARAMETGELRLEVRVRWPNGELHWMEARGRVSFDELGRPIRAAGVNFDVTELKRAADALIEADRRKDEFLAILGHELRNPLAPIQYVAQLLSGIGGVDVLKSDRAPIEMMKRQIAHLVRLVDDLLDISRINNGKIELRKEQAEVSSIVVDALGMSKTHIEAKSHRVETRFAAEPLVVCGDPVRLTQVVTNLIKNAAKFTPPQGLIEIWTSRKESEAVIGIRDNGVGIAPDMLPRVFDLFSQADSRGQNSEGGLGVGLALAQKLVDLHGGRIEAFSAGLDKGSAFVVRLPLDASVPANTAAEAAEPRSAARLRALVIDDNPDVADSLVMLMESFGAEVRAAYDGASGVEAAMEFRPDLAFIDIRMPGVDGHETARRLRARLGPAAPTLIALTGLGQDRDRKLSQEAGFDMHLTKPVAVRALEALFGRAPQPTP
jgi:PAS domain S-box-containing protein